MEKVDIREETVLMLSGDRAMIERIRSVHLAGHTAFFNHSGGLVSHPRHQDPVVTFESDGETHTQVFFYDLPLDDVAGDVEIDLGPTMIKLKPELAHPDKVDPGLRSELVFKQIGPPQLHVTCLVSFEVIEQRLLLGTTTEVRTVWEAGEYHIPIGPAHADVYGVAVSTREVVGGTEHKHQILGNFNLPTGRHVVADGRVMPPPGSETYKYCAGLIFSDAAGLPGGREDFGFGFQELEVVCAPSVVDKVKTRLERFRGPTSILTYSTSLPCDILMIDPGETPPVDQPFSYMLGYRADEPGFARRLEATLSAIGDLKDHHRCIDRSWTQAKAVERTAYRYGIGFSLPADMDPKRAMVREFKRRMLCADETGDASDHMPFPGPLRKH